MWELDYKECWAPKNCCFWTVVLEKTLESPLDCKEIQQVHPLGSWSRLFIGRTDGKAETPILWPRDEKNWLIGKDPDAGKDWRQEEKGMTEDEMVRWHHQLNGHEPEWTLGIVDGQGGLACCSPWGRKESDMTEQLNWCDTETRIWVQVTSLGGDPWKHLWRNKEVREGGDESWWGRCCQADHHCGQPELKAAGELRKPV